MPDASAAGIELGAAESSCYTSKISTGFAEQKNPSRTQPGEVCRDSFAAEVEVVVRPGPRVDAACCAQKLHGRDMPRHNDPKWSIRAEANCATLGGGVGSAGAAARTHQTEVRQSDLQYVQAQSWLTAASSRAGRLRS